MPLQAMMILFKLIIFVLTSTIDSICYLGSRLDNASTGWDNVSVICQYCNILYLRFEQITRHLHTHRIIYINISSAK